MTPIALTPEQIADSGSLFQALPALDLPFDGLADDGEPVFALCTHGIDPRRGSFGKRQANLFGVLFFASHAATNNGNMKLSQIVHIFHLFRVHDIDSNVYTL